MTTWCFRTSRILFLPSENCQTLGDVLFVPSPYHFGSWQITTFAKQNLQNCWSCSNGAVGLGRQVPLFFPECSSFPSVVLGEEDLSRVSLFPEFSSSPSATFGKDWLPRVPDFWHSEKPATLGKFRFSIRYFLSIFNVSCMRSKIWYDGESYKLLEF